MSYLISYSIGLNAFQANLISIGPNCRRLSFQWIINIIFFFSLCFFLLLDLDLKLFNLDWSWFYFPLLFSVTTKLHNTQHRKFSSTRHRARYEWIERIVEHEKRDIYNFGKRFVRLSIVYALSLPLTLTFRIRWHSIFESSKLKSVT